jgi:hypothetical protein
MTTTEKTVSVPVELLQALDLSISRTAWTTVMPDVPALGEAVKALVALIPAPPKVGDVITKDQIGVLPPKSVLRDRDGDVWVITERGPVYLTVYSGSVDGGQAEDMNNPTEYAAVLISLPRD